MKCANKVRALFAENKVRFARAEQLCRKLNDLKKLNSWYNRSIEKKIHALTHFNSLLSVPSLAAHMHMYIYISINVILSKIFYTYPRSKCMF